MNSATFRRIDPATLQEQLESRTSLLVLDVRRQDAFRKKPQGVPGAVPVFLDQEPLKLPELPREQPIVVYCL